MRRLPNKATVGGMLILHEGNHNETGNPHGQYPLITPLTLETLTNKVAINRFKCVKHGNIITLQCNFTVNTTVIQYDSLFKISGLSAYVSDYMIDKQLGLQITDNDSGTIMIKMISNTNLIVGVYDLVSSFILD